MVLFDESDLGGYLHTTVSAGDATVAERVVWGWLAAATGLTDRPDPVPDDLFAWALELGAMAYENPTSLTVRQVDDVRMETSESRREAILSDAARASDVSTAGAARGSFPVAQDWPDPIGCGSAYSYVSR